MTAGPIALVTGASRGIGEAIARRLARAGAVVLVTGRDASRCQVVADGVKREGGVAHALQLDVQNPLSVRTALEAAAERGAGAVEWLVNNAGVAISAPLLASGGVEGDLYERHLAVNFHGARRMVEALLPAMKERGRGRIVNVASSAGLRGYAYVAAYCASKHALVGYSRAAAQELAESGVTLNVVCPHYVDSPMTARAVELVVEKTARSAEEAWRFFAEQNPGGRLVTPEEVAEAVHGLLAGGENGAIVELDGAGARVLERGV